MRVKLGATHRKQKKGFQVIDGAELIRHKDYVPSLGTDSDFENDIGLIKLSEPYKRNGKAIVV